MSIIKKILHQKVDIEKIDLELMWNMHNWLKKLIDNNLNDEYLVITTPNELSVLEDSEAIICIDAKHYTLEELKIAIEKAAQYDDLCR